MNGRGAGEAIEGLDYLNVAMAATDEYKALRFTSWA